MSKSYDNAKELEYINYDSANNRIDFIVPITSNGAAVAASVYDANSSSNGAFSIPTGNTASRPANPQLGALRYNTTNNAAEIYTSVGWEDFAGTPIIVNVEPANYNGSSGYPFRINGAKFNSDAQIYFISSNGAQYIAQTVTYFSSTQINATTSKAFTTQEEPLSVKIVQASGTTTALNVIDAGNNPIWNTASGTIATIRDAYDSYSPITTVNAYDSDANSTITYGIESGSLPAGTTLNVSTGQITGDPTNVEANTTSNFTLSAADNIGNKTNRSFSIIVNFTADGSSSTRAASSLSSLNSSYNIITNGNYYILIQGVPTEVYADFTSFAGGPYALVMRLSSSSNYAYGNTVWTSASGGLTTALNPSLNQDQVSAAFYTLTSTRTGLALYQNSGSYFHYLNHASYTARDLANGSAGSLTATSSNGSVISANNVITDGMASRAGGWFDAATAAGGSVGFGSTYYRHGWKHRDPPDPSQFGYVRFGWTADQDGSDSQDRFIGAGVQNLGGGPVGSFSTGAGWGNYDNGSKGSMAGFLYMKN